MHEFQFENETFRRFPRPIPVTIPPGILHSDRRIASVFLKSSGKAMAVGANRNGDYRLALAKPAKPKHKVTQAVLVLPAKAVDYPPEMLDQLKKIVPRTTMSHGQPSNELRAAIQPS